MTLADVSQPRVSWAALDRAEQIYLRLLRASVLVIATILIVAALAWGAISLVKVLRSPDSVTEQSSGVTATEIVNTTAPATGTSAAPMDRKNTAEQQRFYDDANKRYYAIYKRSFEAFQRGEEKKITASEFDDLMLNTRARLAAVLDGSLDFATDRTDVETFLKVVAEAATSATTRDALGRYKSARKQRVATKVQRTRTERRRGWDSYSSDCAYWYETPVGCAVTRTVAVPYTETVYVMRYPDGIASPSALLKSYQDRYFHLLATRRDDARRAAEAERQSIVEGQVVGWSGLGYAAGLLGSFIVLMFFFLLIAIERHQRSIAARGIE